jgi:galactokinase
LAAVLEAGPGAREELLALVTGDAALERRLTQFLVESEELIPAAGEALLRGDLLAFGSLVDRSHRGAHPGLANQIPETHHLAESARRLGAVAASAFGAGFGGSVWAMVAQDGAGAFLGAWRREYLRRFPERGPAARFMLTRAGPAAVRL